MQPDKIRQAALADPPPGRKLEGLVPSPHPRSCVMRLSLSLVALAAVAAVVPVLTLAQEKTPMETNLDDKAEKPKFPDLKAKEWKKVGDAGLEIWDAKEGEGEAVKAGAKVTVHYIGWLTNGKEFDS